MATTLTALYSHDGSEPPQKKLRTGDVSNDNSGPAIDQQCLYYLDGLVGATIHRLALGDAELLKTYGHLRSEVRTSFPIHACHSTEVSTTNKLPNISRSSDPVPIASSLLYCIIMAAHCLPASKRNWQARPDGSYKVEHENLVHKRGQLGHLILRHHSARSRPSVPLPTFLKGRHGLRLRRSNKIGMCYQAPRAPSRSPTPARASNAHSILR
jgi:hypothetical protein